MIDRYKLLYENFHKVVIVLLVLIAKSPIHEKVVTFNTSLNHNAMKTNIILFILSVITLLPSCQEATSEPKKGMTKVTILYPNGEGKTFDMDYYSNSHMPMVADLLGDAMKGFAIDQGIAGRTPDDAIPYLAIGYLYFDTLSAYQDAFGPNAEKIVSDIPNYTNIQPLIQISEVFQ